MYHASLSGLNPVYTCEKFGNLSSIFHAKQPRTTRLLFAPKF